MTRSVHPSLGGLGTARALRWLLVSALGAALLTPACSNYLGDGPDPARGGRVDGGVFGTGGSSGGAARNPTPLVQGVAINDLALDADTVYFTSNQGLAKVAKAGGNPVPLGGFSQLSGLAVNAAAIYVVGNDGSLLAVQKDGTLDQPLSAAMCGGGSGAVLLGAGNVLFTTGPYLRVAPFTLAAPRDLASDVWQAGGPATGARLALDAANAYYLGNSTQGGTGALYGVPRLGAGSPSCTGPMALGTRIATPKGQIVSLVGDGTTLFFTDLSSNGLATVLVVSAVVAPALAPQSVIELGHFSPANNNSPGAGSALATDGSYLYFGGFAGIYRVLIGGTSCAPAALPCAEPELVVPGALPTALAVDAGFLYYGDQNPPNALLKIAK